MSGIREEKRSFSLHSNMIFHLIESQAGSLSKAIAEAVMNSIDAGADQVEISINEKTMTIQDNGKGFESRAEILKCFDVFGFEHDDRKRKIGAFGLGRAQLWGYASTVWRTNEFEMDVDVKKRGIQYDLREGLVKEPGLTIKAKFYEMINVRDMGVAERELQELLLYADIKVIFNGRQLTRDLSKEKWPNSIDEAHIRLNETGSLKIFNLGIHVCDLPSHRFGVGGVVVSKPDHPFQLNIARNAIVESKCGLWRKVKAHIEKHSGAERATKKTLTTEQKKHLRKRWFNEGGGIEEFAELMEKNLFQCVDKRWHSLQSILNKTEVLTYAKMNIGLAKRINEVPGHLVLTQDILDEANVTDIKSFFRRLLTSGDRFIETSKDTGYNYFSQTRYQQSFQRIQFFDEYKLANVSVAETRRALKDSELSPLQKAILGAVNRHHNILRYAIEQVTGRSVKQRRVLAGHSETCLAWTDGSSNIWVKADILEKAALGLSGVTMLTSLLVHEYLHDEADADGHGHPPEFFEQFESVMIECGMQIGRCNELILRGVTGNIKASSKRISAANVVKSLSYLQSASAELSKHLEIVQDIAQKENLLPEDRTIGEDGDGATISPFPDAIKVIETASQVTASDHRQIEETAQRSLL